MKKRLICLLLVGITCLSLVGCGGNSKSAGQFDKFFQADYSSKEKDNDKNKDEDSDEEDASSTLVGDYGDESLSSDSIQDQLQSEGIWSSSTGLDVAADQFKLFFAYALVSSEYLNNGYSYENGDDENPFGVSSSGDDYYIDFGLDYDDYTDNGTNHQIDSYSQDLRLCDGRYISAGYTIRLKIVPGTKDVKVDSTCEKMLKSIVPSVDINEVNSKINEALDFERTNDNDDFKSISIEIDDDTDISFFCSCWNEYDSVSIDISRFISI